MSATVPPYARQSGFDVRLGWASHGLAAVGPGCAAVVIVDVLSFGTAVDVALAHGVAVVPCRWQDRRAAEIASRHDALLAGPRGADVSLSAPTLARLPPCTTVVLPSVNGSTLVAEAAELGAEVYVAGLRNASAVARAAARHGSPVAVVAGGEPWPDRALRVALEDLLGAGAVASALPGHPSPEAAAAAAAFDGLRDEVPGALWASEGGRELRERGFGGDVRAASELDVSTTAPHLVDGVLVDAAQRPRRRAPPRPPT